MVSQDQPKRDNRCPGLSSQRETPHNTRDPVWPKLCAKQWHEYSTEPYRAEGLELGVSRRTGKSRLLVISRSRNWLWGWNRGWLHHEGVEHWFWSRSDRIHLSPPRFSSFVAFDKILNFSELCVEWSNDCCLLGLFWGQQWQSTWHTPSFAAPVWTLGPLFLCVKSESTQGSAHTGRKWGLALGYHLIWGDVPQGKKHRWGISRLNSRPSSVSWMKQHPTHRLCGQPPSL